MNRLLLFSPVLAVAALFPVRADSNLVSNASFQDAPSGSYTASGVYDKVGYGTGSPAYTTGANTTLIDDWTATAIPFGGAYGLVNNSVLTTPGASDGSQSAFILDYFNGGSGALVSNSLGTILPDSTYTLTLAIGAPAQFAPSVTHTAGEFAPEVFFALLGNGSNVIDSETLQDTSVSEGTLTDYQLTFTTGASGGFVGQALSLELKASKQAYSGADPGGEIALFDNIDLTVPEPATYALMGAGALLVFLARWRKLQG